jgi:hypothetical protein
MVGLQGTHHLSTCAALRERALRKRSQAPKTSRITYLVLVHLND